MNMMINRELHLDEGEMFLVNKPMGWSSFDVVNKMRAIFHIERIGHAGTLDRNATGLLIVCTGKKTKELAGFQELEKEYDVTMRLGERTESYDSETPVVEKRDVSTLTSEAVCSTIEQFVGSQTQLPPMWSAAKVGGKRLYNYARKGIEVRRRPRTVVVKNIDIVDAAIPDVRIRVTCSKGTYIRTLVNAIGEALEVGAYVTSLARTRIGSYRLEEAATINELISLKSIHRN